jgi:phosphoribosylamine---glycine ligase
MNLLIIDQDGNGLDLALRTLGYGHSVKWFVSNHKDGTVTKVGIGLVDRVSEWEKWMQWADCIFLTGNDKYIDRLEDFRKFGYPIFGPSKASTQLEINRQFGMKTLEKHGVKCPDYKTFNSFDDAERHVWKTEGRYVFKTLGDEEDKSMSYVSKTPADMINKIREWKKKGSKLKGPCMLQDYVSGIEMGVSCWFSPKMGFGKWKNINFEHKKLMSGNFGPNTGEQGTVMQYTRKDRLFDEVLKPMESFLAQLGHVGDIDVGCIIDKQGQPWPLEFTARAGWPAFYIMQREHIGDPLLWMIDLMDGKDTLEVSEQVAVGYVLSQPEYPYTTDKNERSIGNPIYGITDENWDHLHPADMMKGRAVDMKDGHPVEQDMFVSSGEYALVISGLGDTVRKSVKDAKKVIDEICLSDGQIRDDIGEELEEQLPELHKHNYALSMEY